MQSLVAVFIVLMGTLTLTTSARSAGQEFPSKPIKLIVPFPAGSTADLRMRLLAPLAAERFHQQVLIDNRPGAAGNIGTAIGAKSPADGYTVTYVQSTTLAVNPHLYRDAGFDPLKDLVPFVLMIRGAAMLVVKADASFQSLKDLIEYAKANPGKLNYGTSGAGSPQHLMGERLKKIAGIDLVHVPYKGDAPALADLIGGQINIAFGFALATLPHIQSGKLRALAVTSNKRLVSVPEVPTLAEAGVPGYDETVWTALAVPTGTAPEIVKKLHQHFLSALLVPEFKKDVETKGAELIASSQEEAMRMMKSEYERYGKIVKELGLRIE